MNRIILSVVGGHAGEAMEGIFKRKIEDIANFGSTYWLVNSHQISVSLVQDFYEGGDVWCFLITMLAAGASTTSIAQVAGEISMDSIRWLSYDQSRITGKFTAATSILVFDKIEICDDIFDMWQYVNFKTKGPLKIFIGGSTICCEKTEVYCGAKTRFRKVVAKCRLAEPYCVYAR